MRKKNHCNEYERALHNHHNSNIFDTGVNQLTGVNIMHHNACVTLAEIRLDIVIVLNSAH